MAHEPEDFRSTSIRGVFDEIREMTAKQLKL